MHPIVFAVFLTACASKRFQPVSQESLRRGPSERTSYIENKIGALKYRDADKEMNSGYGLKVTGLETCNYIAVGNGSEEIGIKRNCKFSWVLKVRFFCGIVPDGGIYFEVPARSKRFDLDLIFAGGGTKISRRENISTDNFGDWQATFETDFVPTSVTFRIQKPIQLDREITANGMIDLGPNGC